DFVATDTAQVVTMAADSEGNVRYFDVVPGQIVEFGGYFLGAALDGVDIGSCTMSATVYAFDKDKGSGNTAISLSHFAQGSPAWTLKSRTYVVPPDKKYLLLSIVMQNTGVCGSGVIFRVDDVFLRVRQPACDSTDS